jgi:DNA-binding NarL/FixJ family response regulator
MDIMMPRMNGIQAAENIHNLNLPVNILLLSMYADAGLVYQALRYGVKGYVLKTSVSDELLRAVRAVANGAHLSERTHLGDRCRKRHKPSRRAGGRMIHFRIFRRARRRSCN